jgi:hypothetical protein
VIPDLANGPVLVIIGILVFIEGVLEINWWVVSLDSPDRGLLKLLI